MQLLKDLSVFIVTLISERLRRRGAGIRICENLFSHEQCGIMRRVVMRD